MPLRTNKPTNYPTDRISRSASTSRSNQTTLVRPQEVTIEVHQEPTPKHPEQQVPTEQTFDNLPLQQQQPQEHIYWEQYLREPPSFQK